MINKFRLGDKVSYKAVLINGTTLVMERGIVQGIEYHGPCEQFSYVVLWEFCGTHTCLESQLALSDPFRELVRKALDEV